ncbi:rhodanese-like domain-containing protein, partial [Microbacterium aurum]
PGARNAPTALNTDSDGRFLHDYALRERFEAAGVDSDTEVGVYCGSGVSAAHAALALTLAGYEPALYVGSWSQWSNHPDRPVATGAQP